MEVFTDENIVHEEVIRYNKLLLKEGTLSWGKNISLLVLLCIFVGSIFAVYLDYDRPNLSFVSLNIIFSLFIAFFLNIFISYQTHYWMFRYIKKEYSFSKASFRGLIKNRNSNFALLILSSDYFFATEFKKHMSLSYINLDCTCKTDCPYSVKEKINFCNWDSYKNARRFFIEFSNWANVMFIIVLCLIIVVLVGENQGSIVNIIYCLLCFRIISRSIEVLYAYYKDIVRVDSIIFEKKDKDDNLLINEYINSWKFSNLRKPARISLALHTLFEIVLTFSLFYYLTYSKYRMTSLSGIIDSEHVDFYNFVLYSISISSFNFSFTTYPVLIWSFAHVLQVFISMVLIILSLAQYIGTNDELSKRDKVFFLNVENYKIGKE